VITILDGGLGTELARRGLDTQTVLWSTVALLDPAGRAVLRAVHREYVDAGADVITANTFRTNRRALEKGGIGARFAELVTAAVAEARAARDEGGRANVRIAGSMAPLEDCYRPDLAPPLDALRAEHAEHAQALADAGCDLLLVETVNAIPEGLAAVEAAAKTGLPVWISAMPLPSLDLAALFPRAVEAGASAALLNCAPADVIDAALAAAASGGVPFGAYAHMGEIDPTSGFPPADPIPPPAYRVRADAWISHGATLVGGCCGTTPDHIAALASLKSRGDTLPPRK